MQIIRKSKAVYSEASGYKVFFKDSEGNLHSCTRTLAEYRDGLFKVRLSRHFTCVKGFSELDAVYSYNGYSLIYPIGEVVESCYGAGFNLFKERDCALNYAYNLNNIKFFLTHRCPIFQGKYVVKKVGIGNFKETTFDEGDGYLAQEIYIPTNEIIVETKPEEIANEIR